MAAPRSTRKAARFKFRANALVLAIVVLTCCTLAYTVLGLRRLTAKERLPEQSRAGINARKTKKLIQEPRPKTNTTTVDSFLDPLSNENVGVTRLYLLPPDMPWSHRQASAHHLLRNGVLESPRLQFTRNSQTANMLVLDLLGARTYYDDWCQETIAQIQQASPRLLPLAIVDNRDYAVISECPQLSDVTSRITYSYRSKVKNRAWSNNKQWVRVGTILKAAKEVDGQEHWDYAHRSIGVRTDIVEQVQAVLQQESTNSNTTIKLLCHDICANERATDVSYFWGTTNFTRKDAHLRDTVYAVLKQWQASYAVQIGIQGEVRAQGRKTASYDYVRSMLHSKIVVVAQRDEWEDHYRLLEGIVAGALVLTDVMVGKPTGLENGVSFVEYANAEELISKIEYYLKHDNERIAIARRGREIAMSRHRSWHHMETVVFGAPVTICKAEIKSRCPYFVHTDEMDLPCDESDDDDDDASSTEQ
jgi:hypothetical protein